MQDTLIIKELISLDVLGSEGSFILEDPGRIWILPCYNMALVLPLNFLPECQQTTRKIHTFLKNIQAMDVPGAGNPGSN